MPLHKLLSGEGAGKYLPWARNQLRFLRETVDLDHFSKWWRFSDAKIGIRWADEAQWIRITVEGDEFFAVSHEKIRSSRYVMAGVFKSIPFSPPEAPELVLGPKSLGGGSCVYVTRQGGVTGAIYLSPGGRILKNIAQGGRAFFNNTTYTGVLRDDDGKVVGKQLQSIGYQDDGFGQNLEGHAAITQTQGGFGSFPMGMAAVFGSPFGVDSTIGPLFCGERTSLVTVTQFGTSKRVVFRSDDGGSNWGVAFDSGDLPADVTLVRPPFLMDSDGILGLWILDQTAPAPDQVHLWRSTDRGASFSFWKTPPIEVQELLLSPRLFFTTLTLGPGAFLIIASKTGPTGTPVWTQLARTLDYGDTWEIFPEQFSGAENDSYVTSMRVYKTAKDPETGAPDPARAKIVVPVFKASDEEGKGGGYFCYLSDDGGETWRYGSLIDPTLTGPASPAEPPFLVEHLGTLRRPQAADIVFPHLHDNPV